MPLSTKPFEQIVSDQAVTAQAAAAGRDLDFTRGSVLRALAESFAAIGLWLQGLILRVLAATRASTSSGADLETWMADYGLTRAPSAAARGQVTLSRFTPGLPALVPVGTQVKTADGAWTYMVTDGGVAIDPVLGGYTVAPGVASITLPVVAIEAGAGGNAAAGTVTLLASSVPGIDTVTNAAPFSGGTEAETDEAMRARFRAYIASLPRATRTAIDFAVSQVQGGLTWSILEGQRADGTAAEATFTVVVDDGSGAPPTDLITRVSAAVEQYRPLGVVPSVVGPVKVTVDVSIVLLTAPGMDHGGAVAAVSAAVTRHINTLPLGTGLSYNRLSAVIFAASQAVENAAFTLNGGTADIPAQPRRAIRAGLVTVA